MEQLLLYQLSIWGLALTAVMIATFFVVLRRTNLRSEMRWWTYGWFANVWAMAITIVFWRLQPPVQFHAFLFALYLLGKNGYVWLMVRGALEFRSSRPKWMEARTMMPIIVAFSAAFYVVVNSRDRLGLVSMAVVAAGFSGGAFSLAAARVPSAQWIAIAFGARALLAAAEAAAYGVNVAGLTAGEQINDAFVVPASWILQAHYPLDTAAEWLLAMGCLIGVSARAQGDLQAANNQMLAAQADLRRLADRDPLTGLVNRRALPEALRQVQPHGATLVFFDLNDFKRINDEHGHKTGDDCLVRFAAALSASFRPTDAVVRYAGDEFVVVASGLDHAAIDERIAAVRVRLTASTGELPLRFAFGIGNLPPGGDPDEALRAADEAMYRAKPQPSRLRPQGTEARA